MRQLAGEGVTSAPVRPSSPCHAAVRLAAIGLACWLVISSVSADPGAWRYETIVADDSFYPTADQPIQRIPLTGCEGVAWMLPDNLLVLDRSAHAVWEVRLDKALLQPVFTATASQTRNVVSVELGMFYPSALACDPLGRFALVADSSNNRVLAIWRDAVPLAVGSAIPRGLEFEQWELPPPDALGPCAEEIQLWLQHSAAKYDRTILLGPPAIADPTTRADILQFSALLTGLRIDLSGSPRLALILRSSFFRVAGNGRSGWTDSDSPYGGSSVSGGRVVADGLGVALASNVTQPSAVAVEPALQAAYLAEGMGSRIRTFPVPTGTIRTVVGTRQALSAGDGERGRAASIMKPYAMVAGRDGWLYFADTPAQVVRRWNPRTDLVERFAGLQGGGAIEEGKLATEVSFNQPVALAVDSQDNLYIGDIAEHLVCRVLASDRTIEILTKGASAHGSQIEGTGEDLCLPGQISLSVSCFDDLYIGDGANRCIRKMWREGGNRAAAASPPSTTATSVPGVLPPTGTEALLAGSRAPSSGPSTAPGEGPVRAGRSEGRTGLVSGSSADLALPRDPGPGAMRLHAATVPISLTSSSQTSGVSSVHPALPETMAPSTDVGRFSESETRSAGPRPGWPPVLVGASALPAVTLAVRLTDVELESNEDDPIARLVERKLGVRPTSLDSHLIALGLGRPSCADAGQEDDVLVLWSRGSAERREKLGIVVGGRLWTAEATRTGRVLCGRRVGSDLPVVFARRGFQSAQNPLSEACLGLLVEAGPRASTLAFLAARLAGRPLDEGIPALNGFSGKIATARAVLHRCRFLLGLVVCLLLVLVAVGLARLLQAESRSGAGSGEAPSWFNWIAVAAGASLPLGLATEQQGWALEGTEAAAAIVLLVLAWAPAARLALTSSDDRSLRETSAGALLLASPALICAWLDGSLVMLACGAVCTGLLGAALAIQPAAGWFGWSTMPCALAALLAAACAMAVPVPMQAATIGGLALLAAALAFSFLPNPPRSRISPAGILVSQAALLLVCTRYQGVVSLWPPWGAAGLVWVLQCVAFAGLARSLQGPVGPFEVKRKLLLLVSAVLLLPALLWLEAALFFVR